MTSDMGGLYRIADALKASNFLQDPEYMALQTLDRELVKERIELDRRALAIKYAQDEKTIDFRTDQTSDERPAHELVLQRARAYYAFMAECPSGVQDSSSSTQQGETL